MSLSEDEVKKIYRQLCKLSWSHWDYIENKKKYIDKGIIWRKNNPEKFKQIKARSRLKHIDNRRKYDRDRLLKKEYGEMWEIKRLSLYADRKIKKLYN